MLFHYPFIFHILLKCRAKELLKENFIQVNEEELEKYSLRSFLQTLQVEFFISDSVCSKHSHLAFKIASEVYNQLTRLTSTKRIFHGFDETNAQETLRKALSGMELVDVRHNKYIASKTVSEYTFGQADSLEKTMGVTDVKGFLEIYAKGKTAIEEEIKKHGSPSDKECLEYVLNEEAGTSRETFQGGLMRDCDEDGNVLPDRKGMKFKDFCTIGEQFGLVDAHVLALRLYTTYAYKSINTLRDYDVESTREPFKFSITVKYINDALEILRYRNKNSKDAFEPMDLWRGMKDKDITVDFSKGWAELAPMSATSKIEVALKYAFGGETRNALLFCIKTKMYLERGCDISWLSCFPAESEYLFRPITLMLPCRSEDGKPKVYKEKVNDHLITILEVNSHR